MFISFSQNKINYEKGQVFPFVIAVICVVIILIMITVNLGQIGIIKTDVSNAADAGALAAASVLSQTLLDFGLKSDMMCGYFYIEAALVILWLCGIIITWALAIATAIICFISQMLSWLEAFHNGGMGWGNAKKTALQYAFNNVGVDEPRPSFEQFLTDIGMGSPANPGPLYEEYLKGETDRARTYARSGFSKFMEDGEGGFWHFGEIKPGSLLPAMVTSGYGWEQAQAPDTTFYSSYYYPGEVAHHSPGKGTTYNLYDNWVEIQVIGSVIYPVELYSPIANFINVVEDKIQDMIEAAGLPGWMSFLVSPVIWLLDLISPIISVLLPAGLTMDEAQQIDNNYIMVTVKRHKREQDLGLWHFRYGDFIQANAKSHAFRECTTGANRTTIEPTSDIIDVLFTFLTTWNWSMFNTHRHLFETELHQTW